MKRLTRIALTMMATAAIVSSCTNPKKTTETKDEDPYAVFANADPSDSLFASIERQACFGRCPVYKLKIYKSGYTVYDAIKWTPKEGTFTTILPLEKMQAILDSAKAINYFSLQDEYDDKFVTDLPSVYTSVHADGKNKRIKDRYNGPAELKRFELFFDAVFEGTDWKEMASGQ